MGEICRSPEPFQIGEKPITGETNIAHDLAIDSLAVMDIVMALEDQFDVSIPLNAWPRSRPSATSPTPIQNCARRR